MNLIAEERRNGEPAALALGAYLHGGRLRVGLLLVQDGQAEDIITFRDPEHQHETRARLPREALNQAGRPRFSRIELELL